MSNEVVRPSLEDLIPDPGMREIAEENIAAVQAGNILRCFRRRANLTQQEIADKLHISPARVDHIESAGDHGGPTYAVMVQFAQICGIDLTQVVLDAVLPEEARRDVQWPGGSSPGCQRPAGQGRG